MDDIANVNADDDEKNEAETGGTETARNSTVIVTVDNETKTEEMVSDRADDDIQRALEKESERKKLSLPIATRKQRDGDSVTASGPAGGDGVDEVAGTRGSDGSGDGDTIVQRSDECASHHAHWT